MPATRVGAVAAVTDYLQAGTFTATYPQAATAGNYLLMSVTAATASNTTPTIAVDGTWTAGPSFTQSQGLVLITTQQFYKVAAAGATSTSVTIGQCAEGRAVVEEWTGITGFDAFGTASGGGAKTPCTAPVTTSTATSFVYSSFVAYPNQGGTNSVAWSGGSSAEFFAETNASGNLYTGIGVQSPSYAGQVSPTATPGQAAAAASPNAMQTMAFKTSSSGGSTPPHTTGTTYPTAVQDTNANTYKLSNTASTATSKSTVSVGSLGNNTYRFIPETAGVQASPATAPDTFASGWDINPVILYGDAGVLSAGTMNCKAVLTASQTYASPTVTFVLYLNGIELGRATSAAVASATTAVTYTASITVPQTTLPANSILQVSVFLVAPLNTNLSATTVTLQYGTTGTSFSGLTYLVKATRVLNATVTAACSLARRITLSKTLTATTTGSAVMLRTIAVSRIFTATVTASAKTYLQISTDVLARVAKGGTTVVKRIIAIFDD